MANNSQFTGLQPLQPPLPIGHVVPPPMPMQFRPGAPPPPQQSFVPMASQQFQQIGHSNMGMASHPPQYQQATPPQPQPQRPGLVGPPLQQPDFQPARPLPQPDFQPVRPLSQPDFQPVRTVMSAPALPQMSNHFMPSFGGSAPAPYTLSSSSNGQQSNVGPTIHQSMPQVNIPSFTAGGQSWFPTGTQIAPGPKPPQQGMEQNVGVRPWFSTGNKNILSVTPVQQSAEPNAVPLQQAPNRNQSVQLDKPSQQTDEVKTTKLDPVEKAPSDWIEHTRDGKKFYYNKKLRVSSWQKPLELMTENEKADATTDWKECTTTEGRKFYYNKVTKISKWIIPDEVKLARERASMSLSEEPSTIKDVDSGVSADLTSNKVSDSVVNDTSVPVEERASSPVPLATGANPESPETCGPSIIQDEVANSNSGDTDCHNPLESTMPVDIITTSPAATTIKTSDYVATEECEPSSANAPQTSEEVNVTAGVSESGDTSSPEGKKVDQGPLVYDSKEEAKNAFKALLEETNVMSNWNWDQAMKAVINDRRYAALKTIGERKQAFNEFVVQKKKLEAVERRAKQKKAREDFTRMLEESEDLTSVTRWSKAVFMFENDERFQAIEPESEREDLFADYMEELRKKERAKALEEQKQLKMEYLAFLKSCDFITASSQWRKVQNRLEVDDRCSRLEKIDRLELFQEYVRDLEKEEEEQRKLKMEEQRKAERKNRDEFRKLLEEHVVSGMIVHNTIWRDYCMKIKDMSAYIAVSSNTSGSTAKELFDDVIEDLQKEYAEDRERIEDAVKIDKISVSTSWNVEDFKAALSKEISRKPISDIALKTVFDELLEKAKEKEEKEAKRRQRLADDFYEFLYNSKDVSASSKWEDCKPLVDERFKGEESFFRDIFNKLVGDLKEKEKEKERKRKEEKAKKEKERKDRDKKERGRSREEKDRSRDRRSHSRKDRERRKKEEGDSDGSGSQGVDEHRRSRDRDRKHRSKRRRDSHDSTSLGDEEHGQSKSRRHSDDSKKSKEGEKRSSEADSGSHRRRQKKDSGDRSVDSKKSKEGEKRRSSEGDSGSHRKRHKRDSRDRSSKDKDKEVPKDREERRDKEERRDREERKDKEERRDKEERKDKEERRHRVRGDDEDLH